ncbi:hypothetical protein [Duganella fentianensis]|uniref:hypothetical protein n=1 Tax=Duganella fentianensis TaxID=2692177 RepID=UPI0032B245FF
MTARPRALPPLLLIVLLHGALLLAMLQELPTQHKSAPRGPAIQWLLPAATKPAPRTQPRRAAQALLPASTAIITPSASTAAVTPPTAATVVPAPALQESRQDDPFAPEAPAAARSTPASADELLQQARKSVGRIDQQLRAESPQRFPLPPPDGLQAKLERGINAAHEAVPPKWYQGARMVELSSADGERKSRLYKISTAFGSYCVSISPEGRRSYSNCP